MAKRLFLFLIVQVICIIGFVAWDIERAKTLINGLSLPMSIIASGIAAVMGADSIRKFYKNEN